MKRLLLLAALTVSSIQAVSQTNTGLIEGRVTRPGGSEGIPDVQITLYGPGAVDPVSAIRALYTPNPALTPAMRAEIDASINRTNTSYPGYSIETLVAATRRLEAQLLGLPESTSVPPISTSTAVSDRDGRFRFRNLAPGRYSIRAEREGYFGAPAGSGNRGILFTTVASTVLTVVAAPL
jgi:hypothetical protein